MGACRGWNRADTGTTTQETPCAGLSGQGAGAVGPWGMEPGRKGLSGVVLYGPRSQRDLAPPRLWV